MDDHERMGTIQCARNLNEHFDQAVRDADGPGKFEGVSDKELAVAIHEITLHGFADEVVSGAAQVGSAILAQDGLGFETLHLYTNADAAADAIERWDEIDVYLGHIG